MAEACSNSFDILHLKKVRTSNSEIWNKKKNTQDDNN